MNQTLMRSQYVDQLSQEMPNYAVYQRNNIQTQPLGYHNQDDLRTTSQPVLFEKYDININEKFREFSSSIPQKGYSYEGQYEPAFVAERSQKPIPNFDIEYKGTRSLFCRQFKPPKDNVNKQFEEFKYQNMDQLRQSVSFNSQHFLKGNILTQGKEPIPQASQLQNNSRVLSRVIPTQPSGMYSEPQRQSYGNRSGYDENQRDQYQHIKRRSETNSSFNPYRIQSGLNQERPTYQYKSATAAASDGNNLSNYSRFLLTSGERRIYTSEEKSLWSSKHTFSKPQQEIYVKDFTLEDKTPEKHYQYLQTPNFQNSNSQQITQMPQVFLPKQNILY